MKKILNLILFSASSISLLTACGGHSHSYDAENVTWSWSETESGYNATCTFVCNDCEEDVEGHTEVVEATVTSETIDATCLADGSVTYTAVASVGKVGVTDTKVVTLDKLDHKFTALTVNSDYKKEYNAFEQFDTSTLTVKAVCELCHNEYELTSNDYFVSYEQFGADCLNVGDTTVTVSYKGIHKELTGITVSKIKVTKPEADTNSYVYSGEEITYNLVTSDYYTISNNVQTAAGSYKVKVVLNDKNNYAWEDNTTDDLEFDFVISKIGNSINGFADHYETACHTVPDFSGVSSPAQLSYKYYSDQNCVNEVSLEQLDVGNYYIEATSESENYEKVTARATLTVKHIYDQKNTSSEYLYSEADEYNDAVYYYSCACGAKGSETFVLENSKVRPIIYPSSVTEYETTALEAPTGYTTVTKGTVTYGNDHQGKKFLRSFVLNQYERVSFAFMTKIRRLCGYQWTGDAMPTDTWYFVEIERVGLSNYKSIAKDADGNEYLPYADFKNFEDAILYYNYDGDLDNLEWYSTEVRASKDNSCLYIDESAISGNSSGYISSSKTAPDGFNYVTELTPSQDYLHGQFFSGLDLSDYKEVRFALQSTGWFLFNHGWSDEKYIAGPNTWFIFYLYRTDDYKWDLIVTLEDGSFKYEEQGLNGLKGSSPYTDNALNAILYGCPAQGFVMSHSSGVTFTVYATEIKGIRAEKAPGVVLAESSVVGSTQVFDQTIPAGFDTVTRTQFSYTDSDQGKSFLRDDIDISKYSKVTFAFKTLNRRLCHYPDWGKPVTLNTWYKVEIVKDGSGTYTTNVIKLDGTTLFSYENVTSFKEALIYCNWDGDQDCMTWYSSEVRGIL